MAKMEQTADSANQARCRRLPKDPYANCNFEAQGCEHMSERIRHEWRRERRHSKFLARACHPKFLSFIWGVVAIDSAGMFSGCRHESFESVRADTGYSGWGNEGKHCAEQKALQPVWQVKFFS